jgi:hypothetical protein
MEDRKMIRRIMLIIMAGVFAITVNASLLPSVTLVWDPNEEPELVGYSLYIQEDDGSYTWLGDIEETELDNPLAPKWTVVGLDKRDFYYFALTAFTETNESDFSENACGKLISGYDHYVDCDYQKPEKKKKSSGGGGGGGCFISTLM